jgi:undecaprenyl-diphosphatase
MRTLKWHVRFDRLDAVEGKLCLPCNRAARMTPVRWYFQVVSRLGDGILWYALLVALPVVYGESAFLPTLHIAVSAVLGVGLYKVLKHRMVRERPFHSHADVQAIARPLDRYSFPSGHTLQAVTFLTMLAHYFPEIWIVMLPFVVSVAASRVILGLHYPSDVVVGALIGYALASTSLAAPSFFT